MRTAFVNALTQLAEQDPRITLVVGDLGFGVVQEFARRFPKQFVNAGVAEQNMTGLAAGMAMAGRIVFTYSIANFPTLRPIEQIRNDVCYHRANVIVTSVGGGVAYGALGPSHHALEDLAMMRALPEMTVVAPGDPRETLAAVQELGRGVGPAYLRLGRAGEPEVHAGAIPWTLGKALTVLPGSDGTLVSTGAMLRTAVDAAHLLRVRHGMQLRVISMHTLKPFDGPTLVEAARETGLVLTLEEHSVVGGLGSAAAEVLCEAGCAVRFARIGFESRFITSVGSQEYLLERHGLNAEQVASRVWTMRGQSCQGGQAAA